MDVEDKPAAPQESTIGVPVSTYVEGVAPIKLQYIVRFIQAPKEAEVKEQTTQQEKKRKREDEVTLVHFLSCICLSYFPGKYRE